MCIRDRNNSQQIVKKKIDEILASLPNLALDDVPVGKNESANKIIEKKGSIRKFTFKKQ